MKCFPISFIHFHLTDLIRPIVSAIGSFCELKKVDRNSTYHYRRHTHKQQFVSEQIVHQSILGTLPQETYLVKQ